MVSNLRDIVYFRICSWSLLRPLLRIIYELLEFMFQVRTRPLNIWRIGPHS